MKNKKVQILSLEHSAGVSKALKDNLTSYGWECETTPNVKTFKEFVDAKDYDIYIIDYDIPEDRGHKERGGGDKALDYLKTKSHFVPVIIYSGQLSDEEDFSKVVKKGTPYVVRKGSGSGANLANLIKGIISNKPKKIGETVRSLLQERLGEDQFYFKLISEVHSKEKDLEIITVRADVQRIFDEKVLHYRIKLESKKGTLMEIKLE